MSKEQKFKSVWDALEDDPVRAQNLKLRSTLMIEIREKVNELGITQTQAAKVLCISQPRVSALLQGKIGRFRLDSLVDMAHRLDLNVSIRLAS
ncbi:helix-turn-helix domain-containing protein [Pseudomonadota bacterium]